MLIDSPLKRSLVDLIVIGNRVMLSSKLFYYKGNTLALKENILMRKA